MTEKLCKYCNFKANPYLDGVCFNCSISNLESEWDKLLVAKYKGIGNICPNCKKRGHFGSIIKYCDKYLICGWCGLISALDKVNK